MSSPSAQATSDPTASSVGARSARRTLLAGMALVAAAAVLPCLNALGNGLVWHDVILVRQNP